MINSLKKNTFKELEKDECFLIITPGKGGKDSSDCLKILFKQYKNYFIKKKINFKKIKTKIKNNIIKKIIFYINKKNIYDILSKEVGVHRFIRNSPYKKNSVHTSYCNIKVYPLFKKKIVKKKIKISFFKSSGPGGQNANKSNTGVRVVDLNSGIYVKHSKERSQSMNKKIAIKILRYKINKKLVEDDYEMKKSIYNNNNIRTYNFNKSFIKDENSKKINFNLNYILKGNIDFFHK
ncbi:peptide chain release factor-like protein [Candidatus Vidania fulgoroideorum]